MKNITFITLILLAFSISSCINNDSEKNIKSSYLDYSNRDDKLTGGVKMIPITTPVGDFNVWTKRIGNNPSIKVLLLHGGPGANHIYFEAFDSYFPNAEIEYYYYDQLGSFFSDQPTDTNLWNVSRFVEEVEQVRIALKLDKNNFYIYGQSWGGILAIEYALKYQQNLKGLIISNMMSSIPDYAEYADKVLGPQLDPKVLAEIKELEANNDFSNPRYLDNLKNWNRKADLHKIKVPTLVIGAEYDTMDPKHAKWMAEQFPKNVFK